MGCLVGDREGFEVRDLRLALVAGSRSLPATDHYRTPLPLPGSPRYTNPRHAAVHIVDELPHRMKPGTSRKSGAIFRKCRRHASRSICAGRRYRTSAVIMSWSPPLRTSHQPTRQSPGRHAVTVGDLAGLDCCRVAACLLHQTPSAGGQINQDHLSSSSRARLGKSTTLMSAFIPGASTPRSSRPANRAGSRVCRRTRSGIDIRPSSRSRPQ